MFWQAFWWQRKSSKYWSIDIKHILTCNHEQLLRMWLPYCFSSEWRTGKKLGFLIRFKKYFFRAAFWDLLLLSNYIQITCSQVGGFFFFFVSNIKLKKTEVSDKLEEESQTLRKCSYFSYINLIQFRRSKLGIKVFLYSQKKKDTVAFRLLFQSF